LIEGVRQEKDAFCSSFLYSLENRQTALGH
jgi:hypothetical protein